MRGLGCRKAGPARRLAARCGGARRLIALLTAALGVALPAVAAAHAIVLESTPAHDARLDTAPLRVVLRFNGRIEHSLGRATIQSIGESIGDSSGGRQVPLTIAAGAPDRAPAPDRLVIPIRPLPPGTYVLRYRVLAADGHLTEGALRFTIRAAQ